MRPWCTVRPAPLHDATSPGLWQESADLIETGHVHSRRGQTEAWLTAWAFSVEATNYLVSLDLDLPSVPCKDWGGGGKKGMEPSPPLQPVPLQVEQGALSRWLWGWVNC